MRRHNEGYALVLVLVVLIVLSLLSTFLMSASLRNLESQQSSLTQMQDRYTAQGEIEKIVGQLKTQSSVELQDSEDHSVCFDTVENTVEGEKKYDLKIVVKSGSVQIDCVLNLGDGTITAQADGQPYLISNVSQVQCLSYEISSISQQESGDGT